MSSHPSLQTIQKQPILTLQKELAEQMAETAKLFTESLRETVEKIGNKQLKESLQPSFAQFDEIISKLESFSMNIQKLGENADLEREVLRKIEKELGTEK